MDKMVMLIGTSPWPADYAKDRVTGSLASLVTAGLMGFYRLSGGGEEVCAGVSPEGWAACLQCHALHQRCLQLGRMRPRMARPHVSQGDCVVEDGVSTHLKW